MHNSKAKIEKKIVKKAFTAQLVIDQLRDKSLAKVERVLIVIIYATVLMLFYVI